MKILVTSIGTRGDMEPLLAIGQLLQDKGHHITCLFPGQFRDLAIDCGFDFESLGPEFIEFLDSPAGRIAMGGGHMSWKKLKAYISLIKNQGSINKKMFRIQREVIDSLEPERIIHNGKVIYPVIWSIDHPNQTVLNLPIPYMHYVKGHTHIAFHSNYGSMINKFTFWIAEFGLINMIKSTVKKDSQNLKLKSRTIRNALRSNKSYYSISPTVFSKPDYWPDNIQVLGYHEKDYKGGWEASTELIDFLTHHEKVLFLTFGSMINDDPAAKTEILLSILKEHRIPTIINTAAGGLVKPESYDDKLLHFIERIPYSWILPKVYGVIHHGGSGTTHMVLKYGKPSIIIPHIIDQYAWNKINHELGAGPLGIDVSKISLSNLTPKILELYQNNAYSITAEQIGQTIRSEDMSEQLVEFIINE